MIKLYSMLLVFFGLQAGLAFAANPPVDGVIDQVLHDGASQTAVKSGDTLYDAMDLTHVTLTLAGRSSAITSVAKLAPLGVEPSPWIVWQNPLTGQYGVKAITLDVNTGAQKGGALNVTLPGGHTPVDLLWSRDFSSSSEALGIEPSPWIVYRDLMLYTFPVTYGADGTPAAGTPVSVMPGNSTSVPGNALSMAEIPGSEFADATPRLFVGTDLGYVAVLADVGAAGIAVTAVLPVSTAPIKDIQPIPQYGYIALGCLSGNAIYGIHYTPGAKALSPGSFTTEFIIVDSRTTAPTGFDTFGDDHLPLSDPADSISLVIANGTGDLALAKASAGQSGSQTLTLKLDAQPHAIKSIVAGSLLLLSEDATEVTFEPDYSPAIGYGGCDVTITDTVSDLCGYTCGNANGDGSINVGDAVFLINYIFKNGSAPDPLQAGDANCDGKVNVGDAVYLINYIFKSGSKPCCP